MPWKGIFHNSDLLFVSFSSVIFKKHSFKGAQRTFLVPIVGGFCFLDEQRSMGVLFFFFQN
jgi:hypothetical protein